MLYICVVISCFLYGFFFFFKQKTAYEMLRSLVGSEMCIRDRTGEELGQTASSLGSSVEAQQQQYEHLSQKHETVLQERQQLQVALSKSEGARKSMENRHDQEMGQLREILNGLLRCSSVLGKEP
eukprot:TRINITY_DN59747_c0_g1_i2.p1 TRINITY_DN59747_c0_g1~~TRINITY_DN59747_c0_g1_i2.p1  ORF type:complete len:125 (-),score=45.16 TRINITY_DN59747_c0_g1_i2:200-574(-)